MRRLLNSEVTPYLTGKAIEYLKELVPEGIGSIRYFEAPDGKRYVAALEKHTYYGRTNETSKGHPGITLYTLEPGEVVTLPEVTVYGELPLEDPVRARTILRVPGIEKTTPEFRHKLCEMSDRLVVNVDFVATVISFESGFDPQKPNAAGSSGLGLIQFMTAPPFNTAADLGTSRAELLKMTAVEQLVFVEKYFNPHKGKMATLEKCYLAVYKPTLMHRPLDHVVAKKGTKEYEQNSGFDRVKKGFYTVADICSVIRRQWDRANGQRITVFDQVA